MTTGTLYVIATPIGHLSDMTLRAIEILKSVHLILAENPRHSLTLLNHYQIPTNHMCQLSQHDQQRRAQMITERLLQGDHIALISDAGTPTIHDPGAYLIQQLSQHCIPVVPIPGPSALIAALSVSGLPADRFVFGGFLPTRSSQVIKYLQDFTTETRTMVFYESPKRLLSSLRCAAEVFGKDHPMTLHQEITKTHETTIRDSIGAIVEHLQQRSSIKGEYVILFAGCTRSDQPIQSTHVALAPLIASLQTAGHSNTAIISLLQPLCSLSKNQLYQLCLNPL